MTVHRYLSTLLAALRGEPLATACEYDALRFEVQRLTTDCELAEKWARREAEAKNRAYVACNELRHRIQLAMEA